MIYKLDFIPYNVRGNPCSPKLKCYTKRRSEGGSSYQSRTRKPVGGWSSWVRKWSLNSPPPLLSQVYRTHGTLFPERKVKTMHERTERELGKWGGGGKQCKFGLLRIRVANGQFGTVPKENIFPSTLSITLGYASAHEIISREVWLRNFRGVIFLFFLHFARKQVW